MENILFEQKKCNYEINSILWKIQQGLFANVGHLKVKGAISMHFESSG